MTGCAGHTLQNYTSAEEKCKGKTSAKHPCISLLLLYNFISAKHKTPAILPQIIRSAELHKIKSFCVISTIIKINPVGRANYSWRFCSLSFRLLIPERNRHHKMYVLCSSAMRKRLFAYYLTFTDNGIIILNSGYTIVYEACQYCRVAQRCNVSELTTSNIILTESTAVGRCFLFCPPPPHGGSVDTDCVKAVVPVHSFLIQNTTAV